MSSFGGTVKLTGESEYRKALADISSNLKVLNSEMKTVTSQYDKNDKSVENLSSQNEVLNKKVDEQKKKVELLSNALEQSKAETGENINQTKKWQTELNNAQAELNTLNRKVDDNKKAMEEATDTTKDEADAVEDFGKEAEKSGEKALSLGDIIKANLISEAIKSGLQALANGISAVGSAMSDALVDGAAYADNLLTLSTQTGLSTDTLEKYNAVAELADVSLDTFTGSLAKTTKAMGEAQKGSAKYVEAYDKLGVSVTNADGSLRDSEDVFWESIDALNGIANETERDALAMEIFGKKAQDLNTIVTMGSEGFKELEQTAIDMGAVLGGEGLNALGNLDDQMQIFSSTTASTGNILASAFAPAISGAMEGVNGLLGSVNGLIAAIISGDEGGVETAMTNISEQILSLVENIKTVLPQMLGVVKDLISTLLQVIVDNLPTIVNEGAKMLVSLIQGIVSVIPQIIPTVLSVIETLITTILENLPMIIEMGIQVIVSLIQGISDMLPSLIPTVISAILLCVETILDNLDLIIDAGIELIMSLVDGILDAIPILLEKIPEIIDKLLSAIERNLPKLLEAGVEITLKLVDGIIKALPQLLEQLPVIIVKIVKCLISMLPEIIKAGGDLLAGLFKGLLNPTAIWNAVKGLFKGIVGGIKEIFGIHSPSTVMADLVGSNLALGIGEGFEDTMSEVSTDMANAIPTEFDADISTKMNVASGQSQMSTFDTMVSAFKQALTDVKVYMDDREMGTFVTDTVTKVVYA